MLVNALKVAVLAARPDISAVASAFPPCESVTFSVARSMHDMNLSIVFHLPSWFPGMSFKRQMAMTRVFCKQYLERPFEYSLQRMVGSFQLPISESCTR